MDEFTVDHAMCRRRQRAEGAARYWAVARQWVLGLSLAIACQSALAQAMYRIKPLGTLSGGCAISPPYAYDLNGADEVTGFACNANSDTHAFLWKNNGTPMVDLGPPEAGSTSWGTDINASGLVTGYASDSTGTYAFVSSGDGTLMRRIYDGLGGNSATATAINDLGQVTGEAGLAGNGVGHAFLWKNDGSPMLDLGSTLGGTSYGSAINASGQVAGFSYPPSSNNTNHAFVWKNDGAPMQDLGTLGGSASEAHFINASGQVAGDSYVPGAQSYTHVFFWRNDGTPMQDLGTLGGAESWASALNDSGQITGGSRSVGLRNTHAFVWMNDGTPMKDLGTFGGSFSYAYDINASGQVTGYAYLTGNTGYHAFLWRNDGTNIQDLNKLIDPKDPLKPYVTLSEGDLINNLGDIVADGTDSRTGLQGLYLLQGTLLAMAPRSLAFGNQPINTTSAVKSVTVTNTSAKVVAISSIALNGVAAVQFASTSNCGSSLVGHAICTIKVTFKPATKGAKSATLKVNGGGGGLRSVMLTGTGT